MDRTALQNLFDLTDRVAIVTGGTRGIGLAVAGGLVCAGAKVVVASRKAEACGSTASWLREGLGGDAVGIAAHMGDLESTAALVRATVDHFDRIDIVVNNAATALSLPLGHLTPEAWTKAFDVNLRGPVFLVQEALPYLEASPHAVVVNVVSVAAFLFAADSPMYAASKAALLSFTRSMAEAFAGKGIRVNALAPGRVDTDLVRDPSQDGDARHALSNLQRRTADPDEMVGPVLYLASDASSFMTGQVLVVDGGALAH